MTGHNVMHPMGWDAFGLPAEQYAIDTGTHPSQTTRRNVARFREQLKALGFSYDWDREARWGGEGLRPPPRGALRRAGCLGGGVEAVACGGFVGAGRASSLGWVFAASQNPCPHAQVATCDEEYYRWTQWIFLRLFEKGLAYQAEARPSVCPSAHPAAAAAVCSPPRAASAQRGPPAGSREARGANPNPQVPVNWCPALGTVLANEEVVDGVSERGGHPVARRFPFFRCSREPPPSRRGRSGAAGA